MTTWLQIVLVALSLVVAVMAAAYVVRDRTVDPPIFAATTLWWLGCLVQVGSGLVAWVRTDAEVSGPVFVGYLLSLAVIPPAAWWWARGEPSRAGTAVLLVAALVVPVLLLRLDSIWDAAGA